MSSTNLNRARVVAPGTALKNGILKLIFGLKDNKWFRGGAHVEKSKIPTSLSFRKLTEQPLERTLSIPPLP